jgi:hypothetical protein
MRLAYHGGQLADVLLSLALFALAAVFAPRYRLQLPSVELR